MMLEKAGHKVVEAGDGEEGLILLAEDTPDLVLLDIMMPGPNGWEVCKKIKSNKDLENIPVVVMFTVRTSEDSAKHSYECGADAHINKPFDRKELLHTIEGLLS
jgi:DNA-binding response OmpR family regulator